MSIKTVVAFPLFIVSFLVFSIFLITFLKSPVFVYLYFIFALFWLIILGMSLKKAYPERINFSFLVVVIILLAIALALFGNSVKSYYDKDNEIINNNQALNAQIDNMTKTNDYYISYINFINDEILKTRQDTLSLQSELNKLIAAQKAAVQQAQQNQTTVPTQNTTPPVTTPPRREEDD